MNNNDIYFVVETQMTDNNGKKLSSVIPDEDGWYNGIPVAVLDNVVTRNNTQYDPESIVKSMNKDDSIFKKRLVAGDLFGEYDHPHLPSMNINDPKVLFRLFKLDPYRKAVHYRKIWAEKDKDIGLNLIYADMKPMGPYGKYAKELLDDPNVNFSSSLRALSRQTKKGNGVLFRSVVKLITFDVAVPGSGFEQSSKRYAKVSLENIYEMLSHEGLVSISNDSVSVSIESIITESELNEIFKKNVIKINGKISAIKISKDIVYIDKDRSIFYLSKELM